MKNIENQYFLIVLIVLILRFILTQQLKLSVWIRGWIDNEKVVSVDMQEVIMFPRLPGLKVVIFCKSIVVFNESFAPVGGSKKLV